MRYGALGEAFIPYGYVCSPRTARRNVGGRDGLRLIPLEDYALLVGGEVDVTLYLGPGISTHVARKDP